MSRFFVLILLSSCIKTVPQASAFVVEHLGTYHTTWETGIHFRAPFIDRIATRVSLRETVVDFKPQAVITRDDESRTTAPRIHSARRGRGGRPCAACTRRAPTAFGCSTRRPRPIGFSPSRAWRHFRRLRTANPPRLSFPALCRVSRALPRQ